MFTFKKKQKYIYAIVAYIVPIVSSHRLSSVLIDMELGMCFVNCICWMCLFLNQKISLSLPALQCTYPPVLINLKLSSASLFAAGLHTFLEPIFKAA